MLLEVLLLVGVGFFWGEQIRQFLLTKREALLPSIEWEPTEILELTPPELAEELAIPEGVSEAPVLRQESPLVVSEEAPSVLEEQILMPEEALSLSDIERQIMEMTLQIESISEGVIELVETSETGIVQEEQVLAAAEEKSESEQLAEIAAKIKEISTEVEIISQEIAEFVEG